jgi:hypothetical protein
MKPARTYLLGLGLVALLMGAVVLQFSSRHRPAGFALVVLGLVVQGPLGWWMIRSVGTPRFLGAWVLGILARFGLLGVTALVLFPLLHWPLSPGILVLAVVLFAMLLLEGMVVWMVHSQAEAQ